MQIKTAVTLAGGAAVGFFFGMCAPDETKGKIVSGIKDRIVYALTGEHMNRKPVTYRGPNYARYYRTKYEAKPVSKPKGWKEFNWDTFKTEKLIFPTEEKAQKVLDEIRDFVNDYGSICVQTLAQICGEQPIGIGGIWKSYGWKQSATDFATVVRLEDDPVHQGWYRILITDPYRID